MKTNISKIETDTAREPVEQEEHIGDFTIKGGEVYLEPQEDCSILERTVREGTYKPTHVSPAVKQIIDDLSNINGEAYIEYKFPSVKLCRMVARGLKYQFARNNKEYWCRCVAEKVVVYKVSSR
jgi:hypothetical protein